MTLQNLFLLTFLAVECSVNKSDDLIYNRYRRDSEPHSPRVIQPIDHSNLSVAYIAQAVTVRILTSADPGSGVIVSRQGQTYTVLTNNHVLAFGSGNLYTVLTADGNTHSGRWLYSVQFGNADLALLQFDSQNYYQVVEMGDSNLIEVGDSVYAAGFPNWASSSSSSRRGTYDTRDWGLKAYQLTKGTIEMLLPQSLESGYQIGYNNDIQNGMSGGPVLDSRGRLIGINGRAKYAMGGINAYRFEDSTSPSLVMYQQMQSLSWAIPITRFEQMVGQLLGSF